MLVFENHWARNSFLTWQHCWVILILCRFFMPVIRPNLRLCQQKQLYTKYWSLLSHDHTSKVITKLYRFKHHFDGKGARGDQYHKQAYGLWPQ